MLIALVLAATLKFPDVQPPVIMDYLATEGDRVWVPAGNTGNVYVVEKGQFKTIGGFATKKGRGDRLMGPSSVTVGDGAVYVGNRGDSRIWAIDPRTRKIVSNWDAGCGKEGPRGLALDAARGALMVACAVNGVNVLDTKTGARKGHIDVGEGVDNIDYVASRTLLYASAGRSEKAVIAKPHDAGR